MSKRTKFKLLILAAVLCFSVSLFAGCVGELHVNDFLNQNNALNQQVTYYSHNQFRRDTGQVDKARRFRFCGMVLCGAYRQARRRG